MAFHSFLTILYYTIGTIPIRLSTLLGSRIIFVSYTYLPTYTEKPSVRGVSPTAQGEWTA